MNQYRNRLKPPVHMAVALLLSVWLTNSITAADLGSTKLYQFHHENVLGTSFELQVQASSLPVAQLAERTALAEIDRLNAIFSGYDSSSELSRFNQLPMGASMPASPELLHLLRRCESWQKSSLGVFNPAIQSLTQRWQQAGREGQLPTADELRSLTQRITCEHWRIDLTSSTLTRLSNESISLNAIAKGTILDTIAVAIEDCTKGSSAEAITGASINIGGDLRVIGQMQQTVIIADPTQDALGGRPLNRFLLRDAAVATSGSSERHIHIDGREYSHIMNPITGQPAGDILSATVIADTAETADVLATVCCILTPAQSLQLIHSLPNAKCLIYATGGTVFCSTNWPGQLEPAGQTSEKTKAAATGHQFQLEFEIAKVGEGGRYRRPYVAAWVEDKDGFPVKTLSLFMMTNNPGPRWHRDLRRWYASDQMRLLVDETNLINTISKPTRNPGVYKVAWDGTDDSGKALADGSYTLYIESAREHGTYQLMKQTFEISSKEFDEKLKGNVEIKEATFKHQFKR